MSAMASPEIQPLSPADRLVGTQCPLLLVFSSWAFGGRVPWAPPWILLLAAAGLPAVLLRRREGIRARLLGFLPLACWLGLLGAALLNPSHVHSDGRAWFPRAAWIPWLPTTADRPATLWASIPWIAALVQAGVLVSVRPQRRVVRWIWGTAAMNGFALAAIGAAFHFAQADKLLGFEDAPEPDYFFATFFYKSHWAAYGALSAFAGTALALRSWPGLIRGNPNAKGRFCLFGAASLLTAMTLALPRSRAGAVLAVLLVIGFLATLLVTLLRSTQVVGRARLLLAAVVAAAALASVGYGVKLDADRGRADFLRTKQQIASAENGGAIDLRVLLSRDTWRMARARPVFGWGLGCFEMVFPLFQGSYLRGPDGLPNARFEFAHDDWLQMAAETGMVGLAVLLLPALAIFRSGWRKGGPAGRWGLAGCGLIALYAWVDFPLNNPAVLVLWTVLLVSAGGMGSGQPEAGQGRASLRVRVLRRSLS
jgi:O-antigen ligase